MDSLGRLLYGIGLLQLRLATLRVRPQGIHGIICIYRYTRRSPTGVEMVTCVYDTDENRIMFANLGCGAIFASAARG